MSTFDLGDAKLDLGDGFLLDVSGLEFVECEGGARMGEPATVGVIAEVASQAAMKVSRALVDVGPHRNDIAVRFEGLTVTFVRSRIVDIPSNMAEASETELLIALCDPDRVRMRRDGCETYGWDPRAVDARFTVVA